MTLEELQPGESAVVDVVGGSGVLRRHFLDMGIIPGANVTMIKYAPMGDPLELRIHSYELTLRRADAAQISVLPAENTAMQKPLPQETGSVPSTPASARAADTTASRTSIRSRRVQS